MQSKLGNIIWWLVLAGVMGFVLMMLAGAFYPQNMPPWVMVGIICASCTGSALVLLVPSKRRDRNDQQPK